MRDEKKTTQGRNLMIFSSHGNYLYICSVQSECQGVKKCCMIKIMLRMGLAIINLA